MQHLFSRKQERKGSLSPDESRCDMQLWKNDLSFTDAMSQNQALCHISGSYHSSSGIAEKCQGFTNQKPLSAYFSLHSKVLRAVVI